MPTQEQLQAAINVMNDHGIDFRAPWECTLDDREQERFEALRDAIDAALIITPAQPTRESAAIAAIDPFTRGAFTGWMHKSGDDMITLDEAEDHFSLCMADMMEAAREAASQPSPAAPVEPNYECSCQGDPNCPNPCKPVQHLSAATASAMLGALPQRLDWLFARGRTRPDEPLFGCQIKDGDEIVSQTEHDDPEQCAAIAIEGLRVHPCEYCHKKFTGLPGNACENCMNSGLRYPEIDHLRAVPQTALAPTDLNKVWGAAEACWASDAPRQCVDLLYYEILRLIKHPVTGFDINDVSAPSSPLTRPHGGGK